MKLLGIRAGNAFPQFLKGMALYEKGIEISDEEYAAIKLKHHKFHGEWNYTIS